MNENEKYILGAIIIDNRRYDEANLQPVDFQDPDCRKIYQAIQRVIESGKPAELATIHPELKDVTLDFLTRLTSSAVELKSHAGFKTWVESVRIESQKHKLDNLHLIVKDYRDNPAEARELIEQELLTLDGPDPGAIKSIKSLLPIAIQNIETAYNNKGRLNGLSTGFDELDDYLNGMKPGQLIVIGARPSMGKTTLALNMAYNIARETETGFFSLEMPAVILTTKIISSVSRIPFNKLQRGFIAGTQFSSLTEAVTPIYDKLKIDFIDNEKQLNVTSLKSLARRMIRNKAKILFIDYLTLIENPGQSARWERVGEVSKALKALARQLNIPIVILSQLNREAEGKAPTLADIRQSGEIEEDADVIMFIHRKDRASPDAEILIEKNRLGQTGKVRMHFDADICLFSEIDTLQPLSDKSEPEAGASRAQAPGGNGQETNRPAGPKFGK